MTNVHRLKQKKVDLLKQARTLSDTAAAENREFTAEEQTKYDATMAEVKGVNTSIERESALLDEERSLGGTQRDGLRSEAHWEEGKGPTAPVQVERVVDSPNGKASFASLGEQLMAVRRAARTNGMEVDRRLMAAPAGASESVDADGGFLVMPEFSQELLKRTFDQGRILPLCSEIAIGANSNSLKWNALKDASRANGARQGGVTVAWADEAATISGSKPTFEPDELALKKLVGMYYATDELLQDAQALEAIVMEAFSEEFTFMQEDAIWEGNGAGKPYGIMNHPSLVSVAKETSQAATTVRSANVQKMFARARITPTTRWFINADVWPQLFGMTIVIENKAGTENVGGSAAFVPGGNLAGAPFGTLLGIPIVPVEYASTVGTVGDIVLADFARYRVIRKGGLRSDASIHFKFDTAEQAFRFVMRMNGKPKDRAAITPFKGTNTQSPFVAVATRA